LLCGFVGLRARFINSRQTLFQMAEQQLEIEKLSDMDLVNVVNQTEGLAWRINHDAADGRTSEAGVDNTIDELRQTRDKVVEEIKKRTGHSTHEQLRDYIRGKLQEQNEMWDRQWAELSKEGSVFKISGGGRYAESPAVFETVRAYLPESGTVGPNQYIMARVQGKFPTGQFRVFDDRDITELQKLDVAPMYSDPGERGIVKFDERSENRIKLKLKRNWRDFRVAGTVFSHVGFNRVFETYGEFNLPDRERYEKNEVIIARPFDEETRFYEFTRQDLGAMTMIPIKPIFHKKRDFSWFRSVDLYDGEKI
jgi:hypothetical protein